MERNIRKGNAVQLKSFFFSSSLGYFYGAGYLGCFKLNILSNGSKIKL